MVVEKSKRLMRFGKTSLILSYIIKSRNGNKKHFRLYGKISPREYKINQNSTKIKTDISILSCYQRNVEIVINSHKLSVTIRIGCIFLTV